MIVTTAAMTGAAASEPSGARSVSARVPEAARAPVAVLE
jgi:hypothetical protein